MTWCDAGPVLLRHARTCSGHPRLTWRLKTSKTWMAGTSPLASGTVCAFMPPLPSLHNCEKPRDDEPLGRGAAAKSNLIWFGVGVGGDRDWSSSAICRRQHEVWFG